LSGARSGQREQYGDDGEGLTIDTASRTDQFFCSLSTSYQ
jgi:hypothetical protein